MLTLRRLTDFLRALYREIDKDNVFNGAAALGFYLTLAIFPAMIFVMALIPYLPIERVDEAITNFLRQALPPRSASMFAGVVEEVMGERSGGVLTLGLAVALWASSTGMYAIMQQMNIAYGVKEKRPFVRGRATALALTLLFAVLVLGAFSLIVLGGVIQDWIGPRIGFREGLLALFATFRWIVIVLSLSLAITLVYHFAPNRKRPFRIVSVGSAIATVLLIAGSLGFRVYVENFGNYSATYGSIGTVIVLMLWLFLAGLAILVGAEIDALRETRPED
jgi:membrane protein